VFLAALDGFWREDMVVVEEQLRFWSFWVIFVMKGEGLMLVFE
jgi:hypothetical protein